MKLQMLKYWFFDNINPPHPQNQRVHHRSMICYFYRQLGGITKPAVLPLAFLQKTVPVFCHMWALCSVIPSQCMGISFCNQISSLVGLLMSLGCCWMTPQWSEYPSSGKYKKLGLVNRIKFFHQDGVSYEEYICLLILFYYICLSTWHKTSLI